MKGWVINISLCLFLLFSGVTALAQDFIPIWPKNKIPNSKHPKLKDSIANERIYRVMLPGMYAYFPDSTTPIPSPTPSRAATAVGVFGSETSTT